MCLAREGSSEPALSQQLHSETLTCACQRGRGKGREAWVCWRERCARSSPRNTGQCPVPTLLPEATQGTLPPRPLVASCHNQILPRAWPASAFPLPCMPGDVDWQPHCASVSSSADWHSKNTHFISRHNS